MQAAIEAQDLRKSYPPDVRALDGLSLYVEAGTIFALLGPNGAGKSTTVRVLSTLTVPDSGSARVAGIDVLAEPTRARAAIGVVGQKHGADQAATGRENLLLQGEFQGMRAARLRGRCQQMLERFDLGHAADRLVKTYSGGMQRRLDIAMGLLHEPRVLCLDEPTTGLDPEARAELWQEVERLAREASMSILLTTHYMEEADRLAARVAIVDAGRVVVEGAPGELKSELHGDTIQVELASEDVGAIEVLRDLRGLSDVTLDGGTLRAVAVDGGAAIPTVIAALEARGTHATSVTLARPTLDDVYLKHTGHALAGVAA
jgi:ABC-2 type transport system ATP-binding protein